MAYAFVIITRQEKNCHFEDKQRKMVSIFFLVVPQHAKKDCQ